MKITEKSIAQSFRNYWTQLEVEQNKTLHQLIDSKAYGDYGLNQDFVAASVAALMPKIGYVRSETVSVYFRQFKLSARRSKEAAKAKLQASLDSYNN